MFNQPNNPRGNFLQGILGNNTGNKFNFGGLFGGNKNPSPYASPQTPAPVIPKPVVQQGSQNNTSLNFNQGGFGSSGLGQSFGQNFGSSQNGIGNSFGSNLSGGLGNPKQNFLSSVTPPAGAKGLNLSLGNIQGIANGNPVNGGSPIPGLDFNLGGFNPKAQQPVPYGLTGYKKPVNNDPLANIKSQTQQNFGGGNAFGGTQTAEAYSGGNGGNSMAGNYGDSGTGGYNYAFPQGSQGQNPQGSQGGQYSLGSAFGSNGQGGSQQGSGGQNFGSQGSPQGSQQYGQDPYSQAVQQYQQALLANQQFNQGINAGEQQIRQQPIPIDLVTGQQNELKQQNALQGQVLADQLQAAQSQISNTKPISLAYGGELVSPGGQVVNGGIFGGTAGGGNGTGFNPATGLNPNSSTSDILGYLARNGVDVGRYSSPGLINAIQNGATAQDIISGKGAANFGESTGTNTTLANLKVVADSISGSTDPTTGQKIPGLIDLSNNVNRSNIGFANGYLNLLNTQRGDPATIAFITKVNATADELGKVFGSGAGSDFTIGMSQNLLSPNYSQAGFASAAQTLLQSIENKYGNYSNYRSGGNSGNYSQGGGNSWSW